MHNAERAQRARHTCCNNNEFRDLRRAFLVLRSKQSESTAQIKTVLLSFVLCTDWFFYIDCRRLFNKIHTVITGFSRWDSQPELFFGRIFLWYMCFVHAWLVKSAQCIKAYCKAMLGYRLRAGLSCLDISTRLGQLSNLVRVASRGHDGNLRWTLYKLFI